LSRSAIAFGDFGSKDRLDYTVGGNAVNLAARLQLAWHHPMDNKANSLARDVISTEEHGSVQVSEFYRPVRVFSVTGLHDDLRAT
jgi:class 3 adenylate cyclase